MATVFCTDACKRLATKSHVTYQGPGADTGSDQIGSDPALGKKRRLRLHPKSGGSATRAPSIRTGPILQYLGRSSLLLSHSCSLLLLLLAAVVVLVLLLLSALAVRVFCRMALICSGSVIAGLNMAPTDRDICDGRYEHGTYRKRYLWRTVWTWHLQREISVTEGLNMASTERDICNGRFEHVTYR